MERAGGHHGFVEETGVGRKGARKPEHGLALLDGTPILFIAKSDAATRAHRRGARRSACIRLRIVPHRLEPGGGSRVPPMRGTITRQTHATPAAAASAGPR